MPFLSKLQVDAPGEEYPFSIPAIRALQRGLELHPKVTFLVANMTTPRLGWRSHVSPWVLTP